VRLKVSILFLFCLPLIVSAQEAKSSYADNTFNQYIEQYISTDESKSVSTKALENFVQKLESKKQSFKKESEFLQYTFNQTHRKFLKHYKQYCTFTELVDDGTYNCLTATALYALLLDHFKIDYKIVETNYHIFLLAKTEQGTILLETTDPLNGFISNPSQVEKRLSTYKQNELMQKDNAKALYTYNFNLFNVVDLDQMLGLMYYNLAIDAYNHQEIQSAISYLDQAILRYQSPRIDEFSTIILLTVQESKMETSVKKSYVQKVKAIQKRKLSGLASGY
jgi:hypothetical protein